MTAVYGILFDLDGTLIDNEHLKAIALAKSIERFGGRADPALYKAVMGREMAVIRNHFFRESHTRVDAEVFDNSFVSIYMKLLREQLRMRPGAKEFIQAAKHQGLALGLVSSAHASSVMFIVDAAGLSPYFDLILTKNDVSRSKPDPECYLLAVERLSLDKESVVVFEDTEAGLSAARSAGLHALCIRHEYNDSHDFYSASGVYASFESEKDEMVEAVNSLFCHTVLENGTNN